MSSTVSEVPPPSAPPTRGSFLRRLTRRFKSNPDSSAAKEARARVAQQPPLPQHPAITLNGSPSPGTRQDDPSALTLQPANNRKSSLFPAFRQRSKSSAREQSNILVVDNPAVVSPGTEPDTQLLEIDTSPTPSPLNLPSLSPLMVPLPLSRSPSAANLSTPDEAPEAPEAMSRGPPTSGIEPAAVLAGNTLTVNASPTSYQIDLPSTEPPASTAEPSTDLPADSPSSRSSSPLPGPLTPISPTLDHGQNKPAQKSPDNDEDGVLRHHGKDNAEPLVLEADEPTSDAILRLSPPPLEKTLSRVEETHEPTTEAEGSADTTQEKKSSTKGQRTASDGEVTKVKRRPTLNLLGLGSGVSHKRSLFGIRKRSSSPEMTVSPGKTSPVTSRLPLSPSRQESASPASPGGANVRRRISLANRLSRPSLENEVAQLPTRKPMELSIQSMGHVSTQMDVLRANVSPGGDNGGSKPELDDETTRLTESAFFF